MLSEDTARVVAYPSVSTKERWEQHIKKVKPRYTGISHFIEESCEYKIQADNTFLNQAIEGLGIPAVGPLRRKE